MTPAWRHILSALTAEPQSARRIAEQVNLDTTLVRVTLYRMLLRGQAARVGQVNYYRWSLP